MSTNKTALITGANKGIGKEIARQLGKQGYTVLIGARDQERGNATASELRDQGIDARVVQLDVTDEASVKAAATKVGEEFGGQLDVLVNNAGVSLDNRGPASTTTVDTFRRTYETNVFGVVAVTNAFLPLLKAAPSGRIVNLSSGLGSLGNNTNSDYEHFAVKPLAYNSSKAALNMITVIYANELKDTAVKVNAVDPGYTATDLNAHSGPRTVEQGATAAVRMATLPNDGPTVGYFDEDGVVAW